MAKKMGTSGGAVSDLYSGLKNNSPMASDKSTMLSAPSVNSDAVRTKPSMASATIGPRVA